MDCEQAGELLPWYPTRELSADKRRQVVLHTVTCATCRADLVATLAMAQELREGAGRAPDGMLSEILDRVVPQGRKQPPQAILEAVLPPVRLAFHPLRAVPAVARQWLRTTE